MKEVWSLMRRSLLLLAFLASATPAQAQRDTAAVPKGVRLELVYQTGFRQKLSVRPFSAPSALAPVARQYFDIIQRDLDYSDRFQMVDAPPTLSTGQLKYDQWDDLGIVYLVTGEVVSNAGKHQLNVALHDVVFGGVRRQHSFYLPAPGSADFRMSVHAVSDEIVRWATGQPGMAASRVAVVRRSRAGGYEVITVDSDGENVQSVFASNDIIMGPTWSPDGRKMAYANGSATGWRVMEREFASGETRTISARSGLNFTPGYSPDGRKLGFGASTTGAGTAVFEYDFAQRTTRRLTQSRTADLSPTYSPDGRRIAFNSDRIGQPHIYVMAVDGGEPSMISPYDPRRGHFAAPDWQPTGTLVAFHGESRGRMQVMVADAARPGATVQQLTLDGESEDPSWAPDGRHLVFAGVRPDGVGLYVIDTVSGRTRPLLLGGRYEVPDWSPALWTALAATRP